MLLINAVPTPPLIFLFNTHLPDADGKSYSHLAPQIKMAAGAGIHIYSFTLRGWPWIENQRETWRWPIMDQRLQLFIDSDPQALLLPRIYVSPPDSNWPGWTPTVLNEERMRFADGSIGSEYSIGSDLLHNAFLSALRQFIRRYESLPLGNRLIRYHIAGQNTGEWFQDQ